jgi:hypothetical protein
MPYAKSLRVIGQSLEVARVTTFELEKDGQDYLIRSDSLTQTSDWILRNAIGQSDFTEQSSRRSTVYRRCVSRRLIFHGLIPTDKNKGEPILRHKRKVQVSCLNFCVAWAITLIEPRSALFTFYGRLILFLSITRNPTVRVTPERLLLKNCSNWACIRDSDGPAFSRYGTQTLFKNLRKP